MENAAHAATNVIPFPRKRMRHITLERLDGSKLATAGFVPGDPGAPWAWIQSLIAAEYECNEDEVRVLESEEEGDFITADGIPVARVAF